MSRTLAVIPALNEAESIAGVIAQVRQHHPAIDILVVDDGSRDGTTEVARASGAIVVTLPFNLGVGGAMRTGFRYARRERYDATVQIDADGQHDPCYLTALLAGLGEADVVIGARFAGAGQYRVRGPRRWAMILLARAVSRVAHEHLTDVTSGFRAANARATAMFADHYPAEYLGDTVESLMIAARAGLRIKQVPVEMRVRAGGAASHNPWRATMYLARAVLALLLALVRRWPEASSEFADARGGATMTSSWYRLTLPLVAACLFFLFELLRRRLLREKYAVIWMAVALCVTVAGVFPVTVTALSELLGITLPANLILLGGSLVLLLVSVQLSHEVGRLEEETRTLAEEVALLRLDVEKIQKDSRSGDTR